MAWYMYIPHKPDKMDAQLYKAIKNRKNFFAFFEFGKSTIKPPVNPFFKAAFVIISAYSGEDG